MVVVVVACILSFGALSLATVPAANRTLAVEVTSDHGRGRDPAADEGVAADDDDDGDGDEAAGRTTEEPSIGEAAHRETKVLRLRVVARRPKAPLLALEEVPP